MNLKYFLLLCLICVIAACNNEGDGNKDKQGDTGANNITSSRYIYNFPDSALFTKIEDTLLTFPFVKKTNDYIDSFTNHQQGISFLPDTTGNTISVTAGYNGPERFETYYNFEIDRVTFSIRVMDPQTGKFVPAEGYSDRKKE